MPAVRPFFAWPSFADRLSLWPRPPPPPPRPPAGAASFGARRRDLLRQAPRATPSRPPGTSLFAGDRRCRVGQLPRQRGVRRRRLDEPRLQRVDLHRHARTSASARPPSGRPRDPRSRAAACCRRSCRRRSSDDGVDAADHIRPVRGSDRRRIRRRHRRLRDQDIRRRTDSTAGGSVRRASAFPPRPAPVPPRPAPARAPRPAASLRRRRRRIRLHAQIPARRSESRPCCCSPAACRQISRTSRPAASVIFSFTSPTCFLVEPRDRSPPAAGSRRRTSGRPRTRSCDRAPAAGTSRTAAA